MTAEDDWQLAEEIAREVSIHLLTLRSTGLRQGKLGSELGRIGDEASENLIRSRLEQFRPEDSILSEEQRSDDSRRLTADRVWIVDPLDGTREFGLGDRDDWAVHIALWERDRSKNGGRISVGIVAMPSLGLVFNSASIATQAFERETGFTIVVSESRPPGWMSEIACELNAEILPMGSAGAKVMEVVTGRASAYIHAGGQFEWDSAAPVGVALAANLHASRLNGDELIYNRPDPYLPDLVVCRSDLSGAILGALAKLEDIG